MRYNVMVSIVAEHAPFQAGDAVMTLDDYTEARMVATAIWRYGSNGLQSMVDAYRTRNIEARLAAYPEGVYLPLPQPDPAPHPATEPAAAPSAFDSHYL